MRILIVEDEYTSRKLLKAILSDYGECDTAPDGKSGLEAFKSALVEGRPYGLVCLDIMMPVMDGHEALRAIREAEAEHGIRAQDEVKVIMVTAINDPVTVVKAYYQGGVAAYIPKPIEVDSLISILKDLEIIS
ncbi:response regulator [Salidesulfovibrio brasiliensis]|uniref:response regulator n=1 Tax=Salidesulfovibrio brasiliensis TaxID=221711 RepID=UPI0006CFF28A|nr:response regulator [Salidesulfovibrio brasiliensis]